MEIDEIVTCLNLENADKQIALLVGLDILIKNLTCLFGFS